MLTAFDGFLWATTAMAGLLFLQRALHREIQAVFLIATRNPGVTVMAFSLIFLPGVFLHELSHLLAAKLLGVRTGRFSLLPTVLPDGRLQLGYLEAAHSDIVRDSLVGVAPLISGLLFVAYAAVERMHLVVMWDTLRNGQWELFWMGLRLLPTLPDFWVWFYLTFAVSSTMMPSESDRHAWLPLGMVSGLLLGLVALTGAGPWMLEHLAPWLNEFLRGTALILLVSILIHALLILPLLLLHRLLTRLTGWDVG
ncbi:MAG: hypothetical protein N2117_01505 [Anaerolineales bacterium]|nr:hypothetical protein [Anaerolineales bacterium]MDW8276863.1 hypothetical protein [Anaerolineales bacterium]